MSSSSDHQRHPGPIGPEGSTENVEGSTENVEGSTLLRSEIQRRAAVLLAHWRIQEEEFWKQRQAEGAQKNEKVDTPK